MSEKDSFDAVEEKLIAAARFIRRVNPLSHVRVPRTDFTVTDWRDIAILKTQVAISKKLGVDFTEFVDDYRITGTPEEVIACALGENYTPPEEPTL